MYCELLYQREQRRNRMESFFIQCSNCIIGHKMLGGSWQGGAVIVLRSFVSKENVFVTECQWPEIGSQNKLCGLYHRQEPNVSTKLCPSCRCLLCIGDFDPLIDQAAECA